MAFGLARPSDSSVISMCSRVGFLGTLWPAVCDLLAVSLGRYVSPTIYL
eukprot:COSAG01_NODE_68689_length_263_cov_0.932927_1_plen_48_part_01